MVTKGFGFAVNVGWPTSILFSSIIQQLALKVNSWIIFARIGLVVTQPT